MTSTGAHDKHGEAQPTPQRAWWHWLRLFRGRLRPGLVAGVAGAVLGGLGMAWHGMPRRSRSVMTGLAGVR